MKLYKGFTDRQCQLVIPKDNEYKHKSLKNSVIREAFLLKNMNYSPLLFRDDGHYPMEDRHKSKASDRYVKELLGD